MKDPEPLASAKLVMICGHFEAEQLHPTRPLDGVQNHVVELNGSPPEALAQKQVNYILLNLSKSHSSKHPAMRSVAAATAPHADSRQGE